MRENYFTSSSLICYLVPNLPTELLPIVAAMDELVARRDFYGSTVASARHGPTSGCTCHHCLRLAIQPQRSLAFNFIPL